MYTRKRVYLDWAAAAPVLKKARVAFSAALPQYGNPSAPHADGRKAGELLEEARVAIARLGEVKPSGVVFTSGATEANALAILGSVRAKGVTGAHILYHATQHASVIGAIDVLRKEGATVEEFTLATMQKQIRPETVFVTLDAVNSETGEVFDTLAVRRALDAVRPGILLHVDAAQAPLSLPYTLAHMGADLVTLDAQKVGGVRGIGALLVRSHVKLEPLMRGGVQEGGRRPGTESPALAQAFARALEKNAQDREVFCVRATKDRARLRSRILTVSNTVVNEGTRNAPHILNISFIGRDTDYLVALLDASGFSVSTKSACETEATGSRVVFNMTGDEARAASTLRISWGPATSSRDLERFAKVLIDTVRFLDEKAIY